MSSNNNSSASASVAANQALISLLVRLEVLIQQVLQVSSEEEKMALSRTIAREVNNGIRVHGTAATFVPPRLLSIAAKLFSAQRRTSAL
ncbi:hypothetical protein AZE42_13945, partial [Rhizopogon vesiculosus]